MYLTCPKCHNAMQTFQRSGLQVEQCTACRGVFLDYGELERIIQAEAAYYQQHFGQQQFGQPQQQPGAFGQQPAPGFGAPPPMQAGHHQHGHHRHGHHHHAHYRHRSFLGELLGD